jgi:hypothetical protein
VARGAAALGGAGRMGIEQGQEPALGNTRKGRAQDQVLAQLRERNRRQGRRQYLSRRLHELGPRAAAVFLGEINRHYDLDDDFHSRLEAYVTRLKPGLFIITGVIYPITELYDVPLVVFRGFSSETFTFEAVEAREKDSRPYWVYYLGDFDPSGHDAARTLQGKLERFANEKGVHIIFAQLTVTERFTVGNRRRPSRTGRPQPTRTALTMLPASCGELPIGLTLIDCGVLVGTKGAWANPPVKPQLACLQRSGPGWSEFADRLEEDVRDDTGFSNISSGL